MPRPRRTFTREFEVQAVKLATEQGLLVRRGGPPLGVRENRIRTRKKVLDAEWGGADSGGGTRPTLDAERHRLRVENKRLPLDHDILKKAAAFFARECA